MAQITVRRLDEATLEALKQRARANNRSTEAEIRDILDQAARGKRPPSRRSLLSLVGSGASPNSFRTTEEIVSHVRALRDEWDR